MLKQILPQRIDNTYRGHPLAVWLFIPVVVLKTGIALGTIFNGRGAAQSADGIPLDSFGASGAEAVVALFAIWGLSQARVQRARCTGARSLSRHDSVHVRPAPARAPREEVDSAGEAHRQDRDTSRHLHQPRAPRADDRWPGAVATEPKGFAVAAVRLRLA